MLPWSCSACTASCTGAGLSRRSRRPAALPPRPVLSGDAVPFTILLFRSRYTRAGASLLTWALYAVAKACETYDAPIYELTRFWSGHTLKHLVAAAASYLPLSQGSSTPIRPALGGGSPRSRSQGAGRRSVMDIHPVRCATFESNTTSCEGRSRPPSSFETPGVESADDKRALLRRPRPVRNTVPPGAALTFGTVPLQGLPEEQRREMAALSRAASSDRDVADTSSSPRYLPLRHHGQGR